MIDLAIQNISQAALPWAGVCIGLQILLNPVKAIESDLAGITHVISQMDWYCALTKHILRQDNIVVSKESFKSVQLLLENKVIKLYKALLLYQIKSICSLYQHQHFILHGLANIDDWDTDLKSITDAKATLQNNLSQFNSQHAKSLLGERAKEARKREALLRDIHQAIQDSITLQKEIHRDEKDTKCLRPTSSMTTHMVLDAAAGASVISPPIHSGNPVSDDLGDNFCYSPLLKQGNIRLLRLLPHKDMKAPIQCQLFKYHLQESNRGAHLYDALSYVWGSEEDKQPISIAPARHHYCGLRRRGTRALRSRYSRRVLT
ncbi:hypothetical protein B0T25DRAFT_55606 [Lasiosphaeria hispida]|uniref:NWD NACHT-NTPase N-terminal domain-containing protein n=1 Tax=Lasiosphaeria hispida TaxID=260671 RepID=A0AAJ0HVY4_9PEZI|nr:hypothetical protein B0T25DRAFT_55606 [Lasiosphaeria hispida]